MFRIRRIFDDTLPANREAIVQVQEIVRTQFGPGPAERVAALPRWLHDPLHYRFRSLLIVADDLQGKVKGFALLLHAPDLGFCYLDFLATAKGRVGGGIGGALYERVREEALALDAVGLFFECLPDDPALCRDPQVLKQNVARLRFYERHGARPIANTAYETPFKPGADCPPYLMYDDLGRGKALPLDQARTIVRAILEREYGTRCPPGYADGVVGSFRDDPVRLRAPRYVKAEVSPAGRRTCPADERIALVVNDQQVIHHIHERGYVEAPARIDAILRGLQRSDLFERIDPRHFPDLHVRVVHDGEFVDYLKRVCEGLEPGASIYPNVFHIRNATRPPKDMAVRAGYYCIDTFTPLNHNAYPAARRAVDCALTAAQEVRSGRRLAYALVRPPGHHAERRSFGGFCYLNPSAIAAHYLSAHGRVAVLDLDYHHGNGTQDIFYDRPDVLTISIHGHPSLAYPHFSGFGDERGVGAGEGYNLNLPLPERVDGEAYRSALRRALARVRRFRPQFLVVALGFDTTRRDPTGSWQLQDEDLQANGGIVGALGVPTLVVQEGGYYTRSLGGSASHFFRGLWAGAHASEAGPGRS